MPKLFLPHRTVILLLLSLPFSPSLAEEKYRIGYFEQIPIYQQITFAKFQESSQQLLKSKHWESLFEFPAEAYISINPDIKEEGEKQAQLLVTGAYGHLDAIIVRGTMATRAILKVTNNNPSLPIFAESIKDPQKQGFVQNEHDSGIDNFTVSIAPGRYQRMFEIFYHEVRFKRLGLLYVDDEHKNMQTHMEDAEVLSQEKEFITLPYSLSNFDPSSKEEQKPQKNRCSQDNLTCCLAALNTLVMRGIDAFFIPSLNCFDWTKNDVKPLMDFLMDKQIPTFAMEGSKSVQGGAMIGFSATDILISSSRVAEKLYQVLVEGKKPRELEMRDATLPRMVLNTSVALKIGFNLSFEIQGASDEIYEEIWPRERILNGAK